MKNIVPYPHYFSLNINSGSKFFAVVFIQLFICITGGLQSLVSLSVNKSGNENAPGIFCYNSHFQIPIHRSYTKIQKEHVLNSHRLIFISLNFLSNFIYFYHSKPKGL